MPQSLVRRLLIVSAGVIGLWEPSKLLAQIHQQSAGTDGPSFVRGADGRWERQTQKQTLSEVPTESPLHGVEVIDSPGGRSATVVWVDASASTDLRPGDLVDEIQLPGLPDRERQANPGYWPYQVWGSADFYRLAVQCAPSCLVRLRGSESTRFGASQTVSGPVVFGYKLLGSGTGFQQTLDPSSTKVAGYVDTRTGERFEPSAATAFAPLSAETAAAGR
jgi:hypothetical protein